MSSSALPLLTAFEAIVASRRSAGRFDPSRTVPPALLSRVMAATARSPTGFNMQPYRVVLVRSPAVREVLSRAMSGRGNASRVVEAPLTAVFAADLRPLESMAAVLAVEAAWCGRAGRYLRGMPTDAALLLGGAGTGTGACSGRSAAGALLSSVAPGFLPTPPSSVEAWSTKAAGLAAMTYMHAAAAAGLATHAMEGLDAHAVRAACGIPQRYAIPLVISTGYTLEEEQSVGSSTPRLDMGELFREDAWETPWGAGGGA